MTLYKNPLITQEQALARFRYDPDTGELLSLARSARWHGKPLVRRREDGYGVLHVSIGGKSYPNVRAHRLIWLLQTGAWPDGFIDHIDGNRANNRWSNLRLTDKAGNAQNNSIGPRNTSGLLGVCPSGRPKKPWAAFISRDSKTVGLGRFKTPEEAHAAYLKARAELFVQQPVPRDLQMPNTPGYRAPEWMGTK